MLAGCQSLLHSVYVKGSGDLFVVAFSFLIFFVSPRPLLPSPSLSPCATVCGYGWTFPRLGEEVDILHDWTRAPSWAFYFFFWCLA